MSKQSTLEKYQELEKLVRSSQRKADEAQGRIKLLADRLRKEFDCASPKEARALVKELDQKIATMQDELGRLVDEFEDKWRSKLNAIEDL